jgi:transposase InsO family protein
VDGLLRRKRYLIHDRDPLFTAEFLNILAASGVQSVKLPPRSPNLNAYAERFVRTIKESCLDRMILFGKVRYANRSKNLLRIITMNAITKDWEIV